VLERAHVVEPVGQLHHQHADVARHGHDHLAEALGLQVLLGGEVDVAELGDAVHQEGDLLAELVLDLGVGDAAVLHHVVEQRCADAGHVQLHLRDDARHRHRVDEVGVTRLARLAVVTFRRENIGLLNQGGVGARLIDLNFLNDVVEPHGVV
jgi:hypothetical protein